MTKYEKIAKEELKRKNAEMRAEVYRKNLDIYEIAQKAGVHVQTVYNILEKDNPKSFWSTSYLSVYNVILDISENAKDQYFSQLSEFRVILKIKNIYQWQAATAAGIKPQTLRNALMKKSILKINTFLSIKYFIQDL